MEVGERRHSSPNSDLSDAPTSDMEGIPDAQHTAPSHPHTGGNDSPAQFTNGSGVVNQSGVGGAGPGTSATSAPHHVNSVHQRKPRAKKDPGLSTDDKSKLKPKRKQRSDKGVPKKKPKLETPPGNRPITPNVLPHPAPVTNAPRFQSQPQPPPAATTTTPPHPQLEARATSQNGLTRLPGAYESPKVHYHAPPPNDSPTTSSNMYDPVRSVTVQRPSSSTSTPQHASYPSNYNVQSQPQSPYRLGVSPALSSIMNHPEPWRAPALGQHQTDGPPHTSEQPSIPSSQPPPPPAHSMDIDPPNHLQGSPKLDDSVKKSTPADGPTPPPEKKQRAKEQPPPLPQGSGLLSSTLFGGGPSDVAAGSDKVPNIILHIDLKAKNNNIINFARLAEEKYGFAALHPRLAAQKERLARVAAVGAALERSASGSRLGGTSAGESGDDDGSVDIDRDSADDGDALMGGMNNTDGAGNSGTDGPTMKRRRRKKIEEYDQEDPFVDDSELVWESQAAASKDGFFVYCGPLVPEGEKPAVERADGTVKRGRGRGRGGGVGSRGGRGAARLNGADTGNGRATGPGSRGGNITRKPRITKASRELMEREKAERELAARPVSHTNP